MDELLLPFLLGVAALLLFFLFWRRGALQGSGVEPETPELPPAAVVDRLFSQEDVRYVRTLPPEVRRVFVRDRTALAMTWVRQIRFTSIVLMQRHAQAVRRSPVLQPWTELRTGFSFVLFLLGCEVFALGIALFGPAKVRMLVAGLAGRVQAFQTDLVRIALPAAAQGL